MSGRIPRNGLYDDAAGTIVGWQGRTRRWRFDRASAHLGLTDGDQGRPRRIGAGSPFRTGQGLRRKTRRQEVCSMMAAKDGAGSARKAPAARGEYREAGPARPVRRETDAPAAPSGPDLWFPDVPRMELEEVIDQLTARAQDVLAAQGRLRQLLRANAGIVGRSQPSRRAASDRHLRTGPGPGPVRRARRGPGRGVGGVHPQRDGRRSGRTYRSAAAGGRHPRTAGRPSRAGPAR